MATQSSKEIIQARLLQAGQQREVAKRSSQPANSLVAAVTGRSSQNEPSGLPGGLIAALFPLAAGNAAIDRAVSQARSWLQGVFSPESGPTEEETVQAKEELAAKLVDRLGILGTEGKDEWRKHIHDHLISEWLRAHRDLLDPRAADEEFQRWLNEPGYEPPGALPAAEKIVPAPWQPPRNAQAAPAEFDVNTTYDEGSGRHVVTINGVPFAAIVAAKDTPLQIDLDIVDGKVTLSVSDGLHEVVPLLPPPSGTISSEPVPYSETPALTAEQPAADKEPSSGEVLEQRARKNYLEGSSPRERLKAAQRGRPEKYIGKLERSLQEFEQTLKLIPGVRAGVPYAQVYWGEDILGNKIDRWDAFKEGTIALAEDLFSVFEPEDLIELGAGRAATGARAVEEGVAATPDFVPNVSPPPVSVTTEAREAKAVGLELEDFDRSPQYSPLEQQLREGSLLTREPSALTIPEPHELPPKRAPTGVPAEARLEKPTLSAHRLPTKIEQPIEISLAGVSGKEAPSVSVNELIELNASEIVGKAGSDEAADILQTAHETTLNVETRRIRDLETRPGPGKNIAPGTLEDLEPTSAKKVGDPTRGSLELEEREAAAFAGGKPSGYKFSLETLGSVYRGRLIDTGGGLSTQAGHLVPKSTGTPGGLALELTTLNQAAETKLITKQALEIQGAIVERETAQKLLDTGQFPNLTQEMIDGAPAHAGWIHPSGMSEAKAQSQFMRGQLKVLSAPEHPLHQLTESYEELARHLPDRRLIP